MIAVPQILCNHFLTGLTREGSGQRPFFKRAFGRNDKIVAQTREFVLRVELLRERDGVCIGRKLGLAPRPNLLGKRVELHLRSYDKLCRFFWVSRILSGVSLFEAEPRRLVRLCTRRFLI